MSRALSPSSGRPYGLARVCRMDRGERLPPSQPADGPAAPRSGRTAVRSSAHH